MAEQLIRSFLFAPGNHARRVEKALQLSADAVILDLEDAVATAEKPATRPLVKAALERPRAGLGYVRINAAPTSFCHGDLLEVVGPRLDGIILPMAEAAWHLQAVDWLLSGLERDRGIPAGQIDLIPIIETARGLSAVNEIARAAKRVKRLAFGAGDFTNDVVMKWSRDEAELAPVRSAVVVASRAAGIEAPFDTVWTDLTDREGFHASCQRAADLGFQGKMCIHPDQVAVTNEVFAPSTEEVARAERVVTAFKKAEAEGLASITVDGRFVDYPIVYRAERVLARARLAAGR
jgi:citrate lyase subunit beta/citryl-CoA lyase